MNKIIRTVYGAYLQTCQYLKLPMVLKPHTTLNEKFNIQADLSIADVDSPSVKYIGIGDGGHRMVMGVHGRSKPEPIQHKPRHAALFNQLPFILRRVDQDLSAIERLRYRLRRIEEHDGVLYVAYYLRVLDLSVTVPQLEYRTVQGDQTFSKAFEPNVGDLNPIPPELSNTGVNVTTGDYVSATAKVPFVMSEDDTREFLNVCNIIYGDETYAIISEIAVCSGVDRSVIGDFNGVNIGYTDAIGVQVVSFISDFYSMYFSNTGIQLTIDVGALEAMMNTTAG